MAWSAARLSRKLSHLDNRRNVVLVVGEYAASISAEIRDDDVCVCWINDDVVKIATVLSRSNRSGLADV